MKYQKVLKWKTKFLKTIDFAILGNSKESGEEDYKVNTGFVGV